MSLLDWLSSLFLRIIPKAPVRVFQKVFVTRVEKKPQKFGITYFRIQIVNNSNVLIQIAEVETRFSVKYFYCPSLFFSYSIKEATELEQPEDMPLSIPPLHEAELAFCATGIPPESSFSVEAKSLNDAQPIFILAIAEKN